MNNIHLFRLTKEELQTTALIKMGKKKNSEWGATRNLQMTATSEEKTKNFGQMLGLFKKTAILEIKW